MSSDVNGTSASHLDPQTPGQYIAIFDALSHPMRIKILGTLYQGKQHISELARTINISRPLLYMHLKKLEAAGLVIGHHELSDSGKAMKYCEGQNIDFRVLPALIMKLAAEVEIPPSE